MRTEGPGSPVSHCYHDTLRGIHSHFGSGDHGSPRIGDRGPATASLGGETRKKIAAGFHIRRAPRPIESRQGEHGAGGAAGPLESTTNRRQIGRQQIGVFNVMGSVAGAGSGGGRGGAWRRRARSVARWGWRAPATDGAGLEVWGRVSGGRGGGELGWSGVEARKCGINGGTSVCRFGWARCVRAWAAVVGGSGVGGEGRSVR